MTRINLDKKENKSLHEEKSIHMDKDYLNKKNVYTPQIKQDDIWKPILRLALTLLVISVITYMTFWSTSVIFETPIYQPVTTLSDFYHNSVKQLNLFLITFCIFGGAIFVLPFILLFSCNCKNKNINEDND